MTIAVAALMFAMASFFAMAALVIATMLLLTARRSSKNRQKQKDLFHQKSPHIFSLLCRETF